MSTSAVNFLDEIFYTTTNYGSDVLRESLVNFLRSPSESLSVSRRSVFSERLLSVVQSVSKEGFPTAVLNLLSSVADSMVEYSQRKKLTAAEANDLESASRLIKIIVKSAGTTVLTDSSSSGSNPSLDNTSSGSGSSARNGSSEEGSTASDRLAKVIRRALREPVSQTLIAKVC